MPVESCGFVELVCSFIFSPGKEHDLVAPGRPGVGESVFQHSPAMSLPPVISMGHYIFNYSIWTAAPSKVGDNAQGTARHKDTVHEDPEVLEIRVLLDHLPELFNFAPRGQRIVCRMEVCVQLQQCRQLRTIEFSYHNVLAERIISRSGFFGKNAWKSSCATARALFHFQFSIGHFSAH
jgi:hypothetical protein